MKIYTAPRTARHERDFLRTLAETAEFLGHQKVTAPESADLSLVWGWERAVPDQPTLFVESGWLPRWSYQVSWRGINGDSHVGSVAPVPLSPKKRALAERFLAELRTTRPPPRYGSSFGYADPTVSGSVSRATPPEFILVPLQVETDSNLRGARDRYMQSFVDRLSRWNPPVPMVFKRHPAKVAANAEVGKRRDEDVLTEYRDATTHAYLKLPGCKAVVTLNSNTAHDALLWDVPVIALERGPWPPDGPFWCDGLPKSWQGFQRFAAGKGMKDARLAYALTLMREQWDMERAESEEEVARLIARAVGK